MKRILFSVLATFVAFAISLEAQTKSPHISFEKTKHDYGTILESKGTADYKFVFTNTGGEPLVITKVKASCGCTTPTYSKEPIPPGSKGFVSVAYNPKNRPGKFHKTITVTTNADNPTTILRIVGEVTPREKTVEDLYPHKVEGVRMKTNHVSFGKITNKDVKTKDLEIINTSDKEVKVTMEKVPGHIKYQAIPETLKPNEKGRVTITYDASLKKDWGFIADRPYLVVDGNYNPRERSSMISVSATITEDFSNLSDEEKANAPHIEFENKTFNFGKINQGESVNHVFKFKNTGKTDLIIRKTKASCGCTVVNPEDKIIKPGMESKFKTTFNSRGKKGKQNKVITVITNDPENSQIMLKVVGEVNPVTVNKEK